MKISGMIKYLGTALLIVLFHCTGTPFASSLKEQNSQILIENTGDMEIFYRAPGITGSPASREIYIASDLRFSKALLMGMGFHQHPGEKSLGMAIRINHKEFPVTQSIESGKTADFAIELPKGALKPGFNQIEAYILYQGTEIEFNHWVSVVLHLE